MSVNSQSLRHVGKNGPQFMFEGDIYFNSNIEKENLNITKWTLNFSRGQKSKQSFYKQMQEASQIDQFFEAISTCIPPPPDELILLKL